MSFGPGKLLPFIKLMLITNGVMFFAQYFYPALTGALGLTPAAFFNQFPNLLYQPFTYMFLHGGFGHIFFNMFALWMFGTEIEASFGTKSFGKFYILAGLSGAFLTLIVNSSQPYPMIGASAAIYGLLVAYWIMFPNRHLYIYFLFPVKVKYAIPGMMILGFLFSGGHVAHWAHLGGALFGLAYLKLDLRWIKLGRKIKDYKYQRQSAKLEKNRVKAEEIMKRVDEILDKINQVGIDNISKADRKFLEEASTHLADKNIKD
ncbi:MAG: rhomboid family intramembrane serine protease [candidate division Zixibacteria bacterium]|nr:rhomboid family intramembrane serine protease [candidate division Zixibacteria bacterium]MDH3936757.1 rhomboid family intramembrane serine protease [candidate division Zixibacteria bacterium]MDH4035239.1 rhomboid family intramembrane serine protease [candidate division Zixibacteria bacterium]